MKHLLLPLLAILCAGCGSDGSDRLSQDTLRERANAICAGHFREINRLQRGIDPSDDAEGENPLADLGRVLPKVADEFRALAGDLSELEPPESLEQDYDLTLSRIERLANELDRAANAARAGDRGAFQAVLGESAAAESTQRFFRENKFEDCS